MLVRFTICKDDLNTSLPILEASNRLSKNIWNSRLAGAGNSNIHMVFGTANDNGQFEFVWAFGHFSLEEIEKEIDFPELLSCEAYETIAAEPPSIIANVGRIVDASADSEEGEVDGDDQALLINILANNEETRGDQ